MTRYSPGFFPDYFLETCSLFLRIETVLFNESIMDKALLKPKSIDKEKISGLTFPKDEVLSSEQERKQRHHDLEKATTLGNVEHNKIVVVFSDADGIKEVNTTIWATTDTRIILKGGVVVPIHRIHEVRIV
jgi:hypothetical protein